MRSLFVALLLTLAASPLQAGEFRAGVGIWLLTEDGLDFHFSFRPEKSHWQYGLRVLRYTEDSDYNGVTFSRVTTTNAGPTLSYLFTPEERGSWYLGVSLLFWEQEEKSVRTGGAGKDSTTTLFLGGGYTGRLGTNGYYDLGIQLTPVTLTTTTLDTSQEASGVDIRAQIGFRF